MPIFKIDDNYAQQLLTEHQLANYRLKVGIHYYELAICDPDAHEHLVYTYSGLIIFTSAFTLWWIVNTFVLNSKDAMLFHKVVIVIPLIKIVELLTLFYFWHNNCTSAKGMASQTFLYRDLYETGFYSLIFALSNGMNLKSKSMELKEWVCFSIVVVLILVLEMFCYQSKDPYDPTHSFNLYVFILLFCLCISGIVRTCITLNHQHTIAVQEGKDRYLFLYQRKRCIFVTFVLVTVCFFALEASFQFVLIEILSEPFLTVLAHEGLLILTMCVVLTAYRAREYFHYYHFELAEVPQIMGVINNWGEEEIELAQNDSF